MTERERNIEIEGDKKEHRERERERETKGQGMNSILLCHNSIIYLMHDKKVEFGSRLLNRVYGNKYVHSLYHTKDVKNGTC